MWYYPTKCIKSVLFTASTRLNDGVSWWPSAAGRLRHPDQPGRSHWTLETQSTCISRQPILTSDATAYTATYRSVSGLQSGSGKRLLRKPVPKSWAFSPNQKIPQQRWGLCHGSTRLGLHLYTHTEYRVSLMYQAHRMWHTCISLFPAGVCCPLQTSWSLCSCGGIKSSQ